MDDVKNQQVATGQEKKHKTSSPIRRLFRHSAVYSLSTSIQRLQGLIMLPIYTSTAYIPKPSDFGNYGLIYTFIAFMNFVYLFGMDSAFLRYFFLGRRDRKTVFSTTFLVLTGAGIVTSIFLFIFAAPLSRLILFTADLTPYIRLAALILFFDTIGNLPFLILRAEERPVSFTVFRMSRFGLELLLNILFVVILKRGVIGILYANVLASVINFVVMSPFALKYFRFTIDVPLLKEMVHFGLPFLPNGIAYMTIEMVDRFLVTDYLGKDVMAYYHANYKFASILLLLIVGFRNAWQPFFLKIAEEPNARAVYSRILNYYLLLAGGIVIFMTFFIRDILTLHFFDAFYLLGKDYWAGIGIIPWIVLSYFFFGIYVIFTPAFYITKKSKFMVLFTGTGAVLNIVCNILLLPVLGMWGAVIATVAAYLAMAALIYVVAQQVFPLPLNWNKIFGVLGMVGFAYLFYYILNPNFVWRVIAYVGIIAAGIFLFFSQSERDQLRFSMMTVFKRIGITSK
ncbi:MAG: oligosaccharide flippase family protein [Calditrichia bacterium]